ncbi:YesL family protein [Bifidobacterium cuniculi]|uniref:Transferase n=1 Tax=Bifidobacterium cuniculi TaxID=1688 RepID=A0A087AZG2_9BIFI|nr:YesL family protein [Bifidobacterium cuniculi]KFI64162.1 transferase [Bifidobacterium cuniculi]
MKFLSPDSRFMQGWSNLVDAVIVNILMLVTSIPVFTAGAALSAGQSAIRKMLIGEGHVTRNYFAAFKENFPRATLLWLVYLVSGAGLAYSWVVLQITPLLIPKIGLSIVWVIGFEWTFCLQARFDNTPMRTFVNGFVFGVTYFPATLAMAAIDTVFVGLFVFSWLRFPQALFLIVVLGYGSVLSLHVPIQEYVLKRYTGQSFSTHA